jgi:hypothetical protein
LRGKLRKSFGLNTCLSTLGPPLRVSPTARSHGGRGAGYRTACASRIADSMISSARSISACVTVSGGVRVRTLP